MKTLLIALALFAGAAHAETLIPLQKPADVHSARGVVCDGAGFNVDDTLSGSCYTVAASACSGRGCVPLMTYSVYATLWALDGGVVADVFCGTHRYHYPAVDSWVYAPGFTPATCYMPPAAAGAAKAIGIYWYYTVATSADGTREAVTGQAGQFIGVF